MLELAGACAETGPATETAVAEAEEGARDVNGFDSALATCVQLNSLCPYPNPRLPSSGRPRPPTGGGIEAVAGLGAPDLRGRSLTFVASKAVVSVLLASKDNDKIRVPSIQRETNSKRREMKISKGRNIRQYRPKMR